MKEEDKELLLMENSIKDALQNFGYVEHSSIDYLGSFTSGTTTTNHYYKDFDNLYTIRLGFSFPIISLLDKFTCHFLSNQCIETYEFQLLSLKDPYMFLNFLECQASKKFIKDKNKTKRRVVL